MFVEPLNWSIVITSWDGVLRLCVFRARASCFRCLLSCKVIFWSKVSIGTFGIHILVDHEQHYWIVISAGKHCLHPNSWQEELRFFFFFCFCLYVMNFDDYTFNKCAVLGKLIPIGFHAKQNSIGVIFFPPTGLYYILL